ncbi:MAG: hypothetical protein BGO21_01720 [Dyadobacter sp. 50-39]|nr:MAG: hypothetical protein BGO21_01720 [Dyadobacter sp. 50-39]
MHGLLGLIWHREVKVNRLTAQGMGLFIKIIKKVIGGQVLSFVVRDGHERRKFPSPPLTISDYP